MIVRRNRPPGFQIGEAITLLVDDLVMVDDEERSARMLRHVHLGKDGVNLAVELAASSVHLILTLGCPRRR
jgi:hypothetical protein